MLREWAGRRALPKNREGITRKCKKCGMTFYITVNFYPETCLPGEVFVVIAKQGSTLSGFVNALMTTISVAMQLGVRWTDLEGLYLHHRFDPSDSDNPSLLHAIAEAILEIIELKKEQLCPPKE